jgi:hypothetical protein
VHTDDESPRQPAPDPTGPHDVPPRPFDPLPARPYRGPLIFGIVAATLELGLLLWLVSC